MSIKGSIVKVTAGGCMFGDECLYWGIQYCMKNILLIKKGVILIAMLPLAGLLGFRAANFHFSDTFEVRTGEWPIFLERFQDRKGVHYSLQYRDQGSLRGVVMDTIELADHQQLKYLDEALTALKKGHNGDVATFDTYSVGRADKKGQGVWYVLRDKYGLTDFQQPEADAISKAVRGW